MASCETKKGSAKGEGAERAALTDELRRRISEHEIPPGSKLKEQEIAREFAVSRTRVREVLATLELRGLVERIHNRGAVARRLELNQVFEIYDVREVLEGLAVRRAVENENPDTWAEFLNACDSEFEQRVVSGQIELYEKEFNRLRKRIIEAADNPVLTSMLDSVQDQTQMIMRRVLVLPGRVERGICDLRRVLEAMCAGRAEEAEQLRRMGIRGAIDDLKRYQRFVL
tara:strand:+ start:15666 stop:16349 length:684 start_codon:yes stop_codon:yes gene_type:complete